MTESDATAEATLETEVADPDAPEEAATEVDDSPQSSDDTSADIDPGTPETPGEHAAAADVVEPDQVPAASDDDLADLPEPVSADDDAADADDAEPDDDAHDAEADTAAEDDADDLDDLLGLAGADSDDASAAAADVEESTDANDDESDEAAPAEEPVRRRRPESMEDVRDRRDLIRLSGDWYVVHTYSGYEQRVKDNLTNRIEALAAEDRIYELVIPTEEVTEFKKGKKQTSEKKFLPGYVLIRMDLDDETWNIVRHTPAVTGFVGATASKPVPLSLREVAATLKIPDRLEEKQEGEEVEEETKPQVAEIDLEVGETVRVTTGPFADFTGTIADINLDQAKLRVMVSVFGRETPLEMPFDHVAKIT